MWGGPTAPPATGGTSYYQPQTTSQPPPTTPSQPSNQQSAQKHDIFVGNLAFSTTEEQLFSAFSELGRIIKVRMVSDLETGKPRGFAFIEFEDPQAALSAIRNMNDYEINGRRIRVNFSNSSHLETLAGQLGMDLSHVGGKGGGKDGNEEKGLGGGGGSGVGGGGANVIAGGVAGSKAVASVLKSMNKGEMYDVVAKLKEVADSNPEEARKLLTQHPQLPEAILYLMSELDMIKTPVSTTGIGVPLPTPDLSVPPPAVTAKPSDPRARTSAPPTTSLPPPPQPPPHISTGVPSDPRDPRARPADPRDPRSRDPRATATTTAVDPRAAAGGAPNFPPPPMMQPPPSMIQPPPLNPMMSQPPPSMPPVGGVPGAPGVAGLDPNLIQQVMSLTPMQIAQLPPDKQQSILALRQQITGAGLQ